VLGDVARLERAALGTFDFLVDVGCFHGPATEQRRAEGRDVTSMARPGATFLLMVFGPTPAKGGVAKDDVEAAFPDREIVSVQPAETAGLGRPLSKTNP